MPACCLQHIIICFKETQWIDFIDFTVVNNCISSNDMSDITCMFFVFPIVVGKGCHVLQMRAKVLAFILIMPDMFRQIWLTSCSLMAKEWELLAQSDLNNKRMHLGMYSYSASTLNTKSMLIKGLLILIPYTIYQIQQISRRGPSCPFSVCITWLGKWETT